MARRLPPAKAARPGAAASPAASSRPSGRHPAERRGRRRFRLLGLAALALLVIVAVAAGRLLVSRGAADGGHGPIVLISIDTLRADHLPVYGYKAVATPAIDALAADGVVFDRAYAHAPQTLPSHASILSGELPFVHGVRDNVGFTLKSGQRLLPGMLRDRGYQTAGFASAFILRKETGIGQGFDVYDAETPPASPMASFGTVRRDGAQTLDKVEQWLNGGRKDRFFLFVHFYEPHRPYRPPERYAHYPSAYDGTIAYTDELVGRLVSDLKSRGLYDSATIVFTSDHGEGLGDHGEQEHGVFLYDSTIHVPLVIKLPGQRDAGKRVAVPVAHADLVPTLLDLAGAPVPRNLPGRSLRSVMDRSDAALADRGIYSETLYPLYHFGWSPLYSLTDPRYRFILAPRPELYDLEHDRGQHQNIERQRPQTASSMQAALDTLVSGRQIDHPAATSGADIERFQALGYIGSARLPVAMTEGALPDPKDKTAVLEQYRQGVELRSEGHLADAAAAFRSVLADSPTMVDVWVQLSQVLGAQGMKREAVGALRKAVQLDPQMPDIRLSLASALFEAGQVEDAAEQASQVVSAKPGPAHEVLARVALARGDEARGVAEARLATQADPNQAFSWYVQGIALAKAAQYAQALECFQRAAAAVAARRAALQDLHLATADALVHLDRPSDAEAEFRKELAAFPANGRARVSLAMLYRAQGRTQEANGVLVEMLRVSPTPTSYVMAARTLQVFGEREAARDVVVQGLRQFPGNRDLQAVK